MEINGSKKAHFLSFITAPPNTAIAHCGAKPKGRSGHTRYSEQARIKRPNASRSDLFSFILNCLTQAKIREKRGNWVLGIGYWLLVISN